MVYSHAYFASCHLTCNCIVFPKMNCMAFLPIPTHVSVSDLYIPRIRMRILLQHNMWAHRGYIYINRSQIHEWENWERGRVVSFLGIHKSDFLCSVWYNKDTLVQLTITWYLFNYTIWWQMVPILLTKLQFWFSVEWEGLDRLESRTSSRWSHVVAAPRKVK